MLHDQFLDITGQISMIFILGHKTVLFNSFLIVQPYNFLKYSADSFRFDPKGWHLAVKEVSNRHFAILVPMVQHTPFPHAPSPAVGYRIHREVQVGF